MHDSGQIARAWMVAGAVLALLIWPHPANTADYDRLCHRPGTAQPSFNEIRNLLQRLRKESRTKVDYQLRAAGLWLCNLNLSGGDFRNLDFSSFKIRNVNFSNAKLDGASFDGVKAVGPPLNFSGASLRTATFSGRGLRGANFNNADLRGTRFEFADMDDASLVLSNVDGAEFVAVGLYGATFVPLGTPHEASSIGGLASIRYPELAKPRVVALRDHYRRIGFRETEREFTHAIEANTTRHLFSHADDWLNDGSLVVSVTSLLEALFRIVVFDLPTSYGLYPGRALLLILIAWFALIPVYARKIAGVPARSGVDGIYINLPVDRLVNRGGTTEFASSSKTIRLKRKGRAAWKWAAYFSLLSAFHVGFREFNVGSWIERTQKRKFQLEAVGRVRRIAGFQSLLSVFLLAMWILTYFGRPFQ